MKGLYTKEVRLPKEQLEIDPRPTQMLIDEINSIETKFEKEIMLYDQLDIN